MKKNQQAATQVAPTPNATTDLRQAVRAKTGKAVGPGSGPQQSSVLDRAAGVESQSALNQVQQQATLNMGALEGREQTGKQQYQQQRAGLMQRADAMQDEFQRQSQAIVSDLARNKEEMSQKEKHLRMEQAGFTLGLQDKQYLDNLQQVAEMKRLQDDRNFRDEMNKSALEFGWVNYQKDDKFRRMMNADARQFQRDLAEQQAKDAYEAAKREMKAEQNRALWTAGGSIATQMIGLGGKETTPNQRISSTDATGQSSLSDGMGTNYGSSSNTMST